MPCFLCTNTCSSQGFLFPYVVVQNNNLEYSDIHQIFISILGSMIFIIILCYGKLITTALFHQSFILVEKDHLVYGKLLK